LHPVGDNGIFVFYYGRRRSIFYVSSAVVCRSKNPVLCTGDDYCRRGGLGSYISPCFSPRRLSVSISVSGKLNMMMRRCVCILFLCLLCLSAGCGLIGLIPILGTKSYDEATVPAEFDMTKHTDSVVLVLVEQPGYLSTSVNMRFYLTEAIDRSLYMSVGIPDPNIIHYDRVADFRAENPEWSRLSSIQMGSRLDADMVLDVRIEDLQLGEAGDAAYLSGKLNTRVALLDVDTGEQLWPQSPGGRQVKVGFEIEDRGRDKAVTRLAVASAHCTTRYLYDCKKKRFRIIEDRSIVALENLQD
jgi:hypothetical protein